MPFHCLQVKLDRLTKDQLLFLKLGHKDPRAQSFSLCLAVYVQFVSSRIIVNVKLFSTLDFPVFTTPLFYPLPSVSLSVIFHYLSHVELGYLSASLLTTSSSHSIHPPSLPQGTGSRWISLGAKYTVCACWSLCHMSWWCHFLKSVYCFVFCALGEEGGLPVPPVVLTVYVVTGIIFVFLCLMAKWFLCCAPNFLFSPLCPLSFSLSSLPFVFLFLFRTNLHACLLIISLACLHDVERQAKLLAHIIPPLSVMSL